MSKFFIIVSSVFVIIYNWLYIIIEYKNIIGTIIYINIKMNPLSCNRLTGVRPYNDMAGIKKLSSYPDVPHTVTGLNDVSVNFQASQELGSACGKRCRDGRLPYVSKHLPPYTDETLDTMTEDLCMDDLDSMSRPTLAGLDSRAYVENFGGNLNWDLIWRILCLVLVAALIIGFATSR